MGLVEWSNPRTLGPLGLVDKVVNSLFASITPRSAGFVVARHACAQARVDHDHDAS